MGPQAHHRSRRSLFAAVGLSLLAACAGTPKRTFYFDAIDTEEKPVSCLVVIGDDWDGAATASQIVNVKGDDSVRIEVPFDAPEVSIICAAIRTNATTGEPDSLPTSRSESTEATKFVAGTRRLRVDDAPKVLFILERKY